MMFFLRVDVVSLFEIKSGAKKTIIHWAEVALKHWLVFWGGASCSCGVLPGFFARWRFHVAVILRNSACRIHAHAEYLRPCRQKEATSPGAATWPMRVCACLEVNQCLTDRLQRRSWDWRGPTLKPEQISKPCTRVYRSGIKSQQGRGKIFGKSGKMEVERRKRGEKGAGRRRTAPPAMDERLTWRRCPS